MFEQKVNRCQNYKWGLRLVDSITEKKCEISDFPHVPSQGKTLAHDYEDIMVQMSKYLWFLFLYP